MHILLQQQQHDQQQKTKPTTITSVRKSLTALARLDRQDYFYFSVGDCTLLLHNSLPAADHTD